MANGRTIMCGHLAEEYLRTWKAMAAGGANEAGGGVAIEADVLPLQLLGRDANVSLHVENIRDRLDRGVPDRFVDLVEIATYVYCADQAVTRGGAGVEDMGLNWRRSLELHVPVREVEFWASSEVTSALQETLGFLSEDEYHFEFTHDPAPARWETYQMSMFDHAVSGAGQSHYPPEEVVLFSGGLDSLGGAVREAVVDRRRVALVTHRPTEKFKHRHAHLGQLLETHAGASYRPWHVPVAVNKDRRRSREYTQRSRSFLYAALAATVAQMLDLNRIRFYENGVVSLNLPISPQVVGAKATRTTHPRVLAGFRRLFTLVAGRSFEVDNPFAWQTKAEVVRSIADAGCADTIAWSTSCTHTWDMSNELPHCGGCSQCIDRRFAVLAAGQAAHDPMEKYKVDLVTGKRSAGEHRTMLAAYVETATRVATMSPLDFFSRYGEVARVLPYVGGRADAAANRVYDLYRRHGTEVARVVKEAVSTHAQQIVARSLPDSCLLRLVCDASGSKRDVRDDEARREMCIAHANNVFRRKGRAWLVRFNGGEEFILLASVGAAYLHLLLHSQGKQRSAIDLAMEVAKVPGHFMLGDAGPRLDEEAKRAYGVRAAELQEELNDARSRADATGVERARAEMIVLAEEVKSRGWNGRDKREADDRERIRKALQMAVKRTIADVRKYDSSLAAHLRAHIRCGATPVYDPPQAVDWDL